MWQLLSTLTQISLCWISHYTNSLLHKVEHSLTIKSVINNPIKNLTRANFIKIAGAPVWTALTLRNLVDPMLQNNIIEQILRRNPKARYFPHIRVCQFLMKLLMSKQECLLSSEAYCIVFVLLFSTHSLDLLGLNMNITKRKYT